MYQKQSPISSTFIRNSDTILLNGPFSKRLPYVEEKSDYLLFWVFQRLTFRIVIPKAPSTAHQLKFTDTCYFSFHR